MEEKLIEQTELIKELGISYPTFQKILRFGNIQPSVDGYDRRVRVFNEEQVEQIKALVLKVRRRTTK